MGMVYKASPGSQLTDEDAMLLGRRFERLARRGPLTAARVVDDARPESSPIHGYFEWDDQQAAEAYREEQARYLLRSIVVVPAPNKEPIRAFHVVTVRTDEKDPGQRGYLHIDQVAQEPALLAQVIEAERRVLEGARRRLSQYQQLAPVAISIEQAIGQLSQVTTLA